MTSAAGVFFIFFVLGGAMLVGLYLLVDAEAANSRRMDRQAAERTVRRDTDAPSDSPGDPDAPASDDDRTAGWN